MRKLGRLLVTAALMAGTFAAGCFDAFPGGGGEDAINPSAADGPAWQAGYRWTYSVEETYQFDTTNVSSGGDRRTTTDYEVVNVASPLDGQEVYHVRVASRGGNSGPTGSIPFPPQDGLWALAPDTLAPQAYAWEDMGMMYAGPDACGGAEPDAAMPSAYMPATLEDGGFRFPLAPQATWTFDATDIGGVMTYTAVVLDPEIVQTAAGRFDTYPVRLTATHDRAGADEGVTATETTTYWWSGTVQNVVRYESTLSATGIEDGTGTFTATRTVDLASYDLTAGDGETVPTTKAADWAFPTPQFDGPHQYEIVTDTPFPVNATEGSVTATFAIVEADPEMAPTPYYAPRVVEDPAAVAVDLGKNATITWRLEAWGDPAPVAMRKGASTTFTHTFDGASDTELRVELEDRCVHLWAPMGVTTAAYWHSVHTVAVPPGADAPVAVTDVHTGARDQRMYVEWTFHRAHTTGGLDDAGDVVFTHAGSGDELRILTGGEAAGSMEVRLRDKGTWSVTWEPQGLPPLNRVVGDDVTLRFLSGPVP